jgi:hypothetical protein
MVDFETILSKKFQEQENKYDHVIFYENPEKKEHISSLRSYSNTFLFILMQSEMKILSHYNLEESCKEFKYTSNAILKIQSKIEELVKTNYLIYQLSRDAYKSFINCYSLSKLNKIRDADSLDFKSVCFQFGFSVPQFFMVKEKSVKKGEEEN